MILKLQGWKEPKDEHLTYLDFEFVRIVSEFLRFGIEL